MEGLHWELSVLSKAVHYKNLSVAAGNVGISQPQLSRIISKLESHLEVVLLDRTIRRRTGWTTIAHKIAETYSRAERKLSVSLEQIKTKQIPSHLSIGILEGLAPLVCQISRSLFEIPNMQWIEVNVFDLSQLEERFDREEVDLILTSREPGRHKPRYTKTIGWQTLGLQGAGIPAYSPYEKETGPGQAGRSRSQYLISNSLSVRKHWIESNAGSGWIPSEFFRKPKGSANEVPVILIGSEILSPQLWAILDERTNDLEDLPQRKQTNPQLPKPNSESDKSYSLAVRKRPFKKRLTAPETRRT